MSRTSYFSFAFALAGFLSLGLAQGCDGPAEDVSETQGMAAIRACGLDDGTIEHGHGAHLHACDPQDTKKTTICHVPPGNPANAHTLCIGNAAVPAHLRNHPDSLGPCKSEPPCPPPGGMSGTGGSTGSGGSPGTGGSVPTTGSGGSDSPPPSNGSGGAAGSDGGSVIVI
jgi:hypothetical protein